MDLMEFQAKKLFAKHDVPVTEGIVAQTPEEARAAAEKLGVVVVKAQVKGMGAFAARHYLSRRFAFNPFWWSPCPKHLPGLPRLWVFALACRRKWPWPQIPAPKGAVQGAIGKSKAVIQASTKRPRSCRSRPNSRTGDSGITRSAATLSDGKGMSRSTPISTIR